MTDKCFSRISPSPTVVLPSKVRLAFSALAFFLLHTLWLLPLQAQEPAVHSISVDYELLDHAAFHKNIAGNTVVGVTRQSKSLYMLYFAPDGTCELWKQDQIFNGTWWINKDEQGRDVVHAFWPEYQSTEPKSLFSPENPRFGNATSILYYGSSQHPNALLLVTKSMQAAATVVPGRQLGGK